ncbi:MAG: ATP-binding protein [Rickettsiales bacterium]
MLEFLQKRFIDNDKLVEEAKDFSQRNHYGSTAVIFFTYVLAFLVSTVIAFIFEGHHALVVTCFMVFFGGAAILNSFYIKKMRLINNAIEFQNLIYLTALKGDCEYCLIFNEDGEIVYSDSRLLAKFNIQIPKNLTELETIFHFFQLPSDKVRLIKDIIFRKKYSSELAVSQLYNDAAHSKPLTLRPFRLYNSKYSIFISPMERPWGFTTFKIHKVDEEEEFSQIVDDLSIGFYELDTLGHITSVNDYFAKMLGFAKPELAGGDTTLESLIDIEESVSSLMSQQTNKRGRFLGNWQGFLSIKTKYNEHVHCFVIQKAFFTEGNIIDRIIGYAVKLHDDSLLVKSKGVERGWIDYSWKCFFENSPYPVTIINRDGIVEKVNNAFELLLPGHFLGKSFEEVFRESDRHLITQQISDILHKGAKPTPICEARAIGSDKVLDVYLGVILDLSGGIYGFMVRIADITQQRELEENLSHAQRMQTIGHLVGSVAHDFNNLLTAISGFCDLLFLKHTVGDPSFAHIMQIRQSADRATNLVRRLLAFSRKQTLHLQVVNLTDLFNDFSSLVQRLIGSEIEFKQIIDPNLWVVKADPVQMEQVVLNLVVNSRHAIENPDLGKLEVMVKNYSLTQNDSLLDNVFIPSGEENAPPGDYVLMEVKDNGTGIKEEILNRIFEPFFTTKDEKSGTGLGLSTVYGIVRQTGGYIYVRSTVGVGTTFYILLKKHEITVEEQLQLQQIEINKTNQQTEAKQDFSGKGVIALIEDEEAVRLFAKNVLANKGYDVIEFESALVAKNRIKKDLDRIDLVISDVMMPGMTGPALIKELHSIRPNLKVLFISGYGEDAFEEVYGEKRDFNFIAKPFSLKQLVAKVKDILSK